MNTKELRLGNLVVWPGVDKTEIKYMRVGKLSGNEVDGWDCDKIEPIPLTPEILEKAGFTTDENKVEFNIGLPLGNGSDLFIEDEGDPYMSCGIKSVDIFHYFRDIRYVHQLQNLFFSLTGTELTINL